MAKLIVIIGITGTQGASVCKVFQQEQGWRIRGITRSPEKHGHLKDQGIELVSADLNDQTSLEKAFKGANAIFAVTDFWQFLKDPATFETAAERGLKPNEIAMEREIVQGKNIIHAAAAQLDTLDRLVLSTLADSKKWSKGEITWNLHFDGKAQYTQYLKDDYLDLAKKTSYLQVGFYLNNLRSSPAYEPKKQADGTFEQRKFTEPNGKPIPFVHPPNDTGHLVRALVLSPSAPAGTTLLGYCELMTNEEYCALWDKVNGTTSQTRQWTYDDAVGSGMPDWLALEISQSGTFSSKYGWTGGDPEVKHPAEVGVDMSKLTKVEDWIRNEDWSSVV